MAEADKKKQDQINAYKKVFVGGLESSIDASDLRKFFSQFGVVIDSIVLRDVATNASRGFGFVTFEEAAVATECVRNNNYDIKGKKVDIKKAEPKMNVQRTRTYPITNDSGGGFHPMGMR